jgi:hypothetical protein
MNNVIRVEAKVLSKVVLKIEVAQLPETKNRQRDDSQPDDDFCRPSKSVHEKQVESASQPAEIK